jgi:hypothetical protein
VRHGTDAALSQKSECSASALPPAKSGHSNSSPPAMRATSAKSFQRMYHQLITVKIFYRRQQKKNFQRGRRFILQLSRVLFIIEQQEKIFAAIIRAKLKTQTKIF